MAIADLIVIMNRGRIEDIGPPQRVYERPRTCFSARFLGESTVIEGIVAACVEGRLAVDTPCGRLEVEGTRDAGAKASLALRPEAVRIGSGDPGDQPLGELQVVECIYQGSFARVTGHTATGVRVLAKVDPQVLREGGERVSILARRGGLVLLED